MNVRSIVVINCIGVVALGLLILIAVVSSPLLAVTLGVVWLIGLIYFNYVLVIKMDNMLYKLRSANKKNYFGHSVQCIEKQMDSIDSRKEIFENLEEGDKLKEIYQLVVTQFYTNVEYIVKYMKTFDYITQPKSVTNKIKNLVNQNDTLVSKLNMVVESMIDVDKSVANVDTSVLDDIIDSLRSVSNE